MCTCAADVLTAHGCCPLQLLFDDLVADEDNRLHQPGHEMIELRTLIGECFGTLPTPALSPRDGWLVAC